MTLRTYHDLTQFQEFEDRVSYLSLLGIPGNVVFGSLRHLNQDFYRSREWKYSRLEVINRDNGLDLGVTGYEIFDKIFVHHMNPITPEILVHSIELALDPQYLITTSFDTHQRIHYGRQQRFVRAERRPGDTKLW